MSAAAVAPVRERAGDPGKRRPAGGDLIIGKDILELLTTAMYVDPLTLYREYIQNSTDAIDEAFRTGTLSDRQYGRVDISLDAPGRRITVRDNGAGLHAEEAERLLTSFGASRKRGTGARGFRGVGRLAGLAYCQALRFRTRASDREKVFTARWDCRRLRGILMDSHNNADLREVVREIVELNEEDGARCPPHFFEVELEKVLRIKNDILLNPEAVRCYLSQVAPLPFPEGFPFGEQIAVYLQEFLPRPRYRIHVDDMGDPLTRPITEKFAVSGNRTDRFTGVELLQFASQEGEAAAVGWLLHHGYVGSLSSAPEIRGLRARIGGIQIGGPDVFGHVFPESRFSSWAVGEINIIDGRIVPNGRRDDFEQNASLFHLLNQIAPVGREIARRCRASSIVRNRLKTFSTLDQQLDDLLKALKAGQMGRATMKVLVKEAADLLVKLGRIAQFEAIPPRERALLQRRIKQFEKRYGMLRQRKRRSISLPNLPRSKRLAFEEAIDLIYECSRNRLAAKALVARISARLNALYR